MYLKTQSTSCTCMSMHASLKQINYRNSDNKNIFCAVLTSKSYFSPLYSNKQASKCASTNKTKNKQKWYKNGENKRKLPGKSPLKIVYCGLLMEFMILYTDDKAFQFHPRSFCSFFRSVGLIVLYFFLSSSTTTMMPTKRV